jgi:pimeloyl-ACP methyl ester carboxylesterase
MTAGRRRRALEPATALAVLLILYGAELPSRSAAALAPTPSAAAPPDLLRLGRLTLQPCEIGKPGANGGTTLRAYCTQFPVAEDRAAPTARQLGLKVAIVKADGAVADADLITFLDGGPGGAATEDYPSIDAALAPLRARHHILLIDQRGTGGSNALDCTPANGPEHATAPIADSSAASQSAGATQDVLRRCLAQLAPRAAPQYYTTSDAVRDLEDVRQALGAPTLDLIGISYGTRVAQQYARRYPLAVRSMVLDSPVPNTLALLSEHARNLERALREIFARCRQDARCAQRFGDPYATLYRLRDELRARPRLVELRDPSSFQALRRTMTAADLATVVRLYAYSPLSAALLPLMLQEAVGGDYAPLLGQSR